MINEKLRKHLKICSVEYGFRQYQLAEMCGYSEERFSKIIGRTQLPKEVEDSLISAIDRRIQGGEPDLTKWYEWRFQKMRNKYELGRICQIENAPDYEKRKRLEKALDEADQRRIVGGWDLSIDRM